MLRPQGTKTRIRGIQETAIRTTTVHKKEREAAGSAIADMPIWPVFWPLPLEDSPMTNNSIGTTEEGGATLGTAGKKQKWNLSRSLGRKPQVREVT